MSDSESDVPLAKSARNGVKSADTVPKSDRAKDETNGHVGPGVSLSNGVSTTSMGIDSPNANGTKRKGRVSNGAKASYKEHSESEDEPLSKRRRTSTKPVKKEASDSDSDVPLAKKPTAKDVNSLSKQKEKFEKRAEQEAKAIRKEAPQKKAKKQDTPKAAAKGPAAAKGSAAAASAKSKKAAVKEEDEDEDEDAEYRWWENMQQSDGTTKWTTLEHNGVVFPPAYEPLPKNVKFIYDGQPINLHPEAEEVATFYGGMLHSTVNVENPTFNKNFFEDFQKYIKDTGGAKHAKTGDKIDIKSFDKCNFKPIFEWFDAERQKNKERPAAEKKLIKAEKDKAEAPYQYCMWDSRKQKVGNFRVEPPALFRGRGEHPKTGRVKKRVLPEQITINIGKDATVPAPPEGHKWKEVKHDNEGTWLAMWQENINGAYKYVMLAANSDVKGQSDYKKFEKAREF